MTQDPPVESLLEVAQQTITAAGCASLITVDESGHPSSRSVTAFPPDGDFARIVIETHPDSRKYAHVLRDPREVAPNRRQAVQRLGATSPRCTVDEVQDAKLPEHHPGREVPCSTPLHLATMDEEVADAVVDMRV